MEIFARIKEIFVKRRMTAVQFARFSVVGFLNTGVDFGIYVALTRLTDFFHRHIVAASLISVTAAVACSYLLNTFWTFRHRTVGWRRAVKFGIVAFSGLGWNVLILFLLTHAGLYDLWAKLVATAIVLAWNFTLQKKWTFR